jgi:hypothetical protein
MLGVWGFAPLAAFIDSRPSRHRINRSHGKFAGVKLAWCCIVSGGAGAVIRSRLRRRVLSGERNKKEETL